MRLPRSGLRLVIWLLDGAHSWCEGGSSQHTFALLFLWSLCLRRVSESTTPNSVVSWETSYHRRRPCLAWREMRGGNTVTHGGSTQHEGHLHTAGFTHTRVLLRSGGFTSSNDDHTL